MRLSLKTKLDAKLKELKGVELKFLEFNTSAWNSENILRNIEMYVAELRREIKTIEWFIKLEEQDEHDAISYNPVDISELPL